MPLSPSTNKTNLHRSNLTDIFIQQRCQLFNMPKNPLFRFTAGRIKPRMIVCKTKNSFISLRFHQLKHLADIIQSLIIKIFTHPFGQIDILLHKSQIIVFRIKLLYFLFIQILTIYFIIIIWTFHLISQQITFKMKASIRISQRLDMNNFTYNFRSFRFIRTFFLSILSCIHIYRIRTKATHNT